MVYHINMIDLNIDRDSESPIYQQISQSIKKLIDSNILKAGTRLPATRMLAKSYNLNRSTVYRAYRELWSLGYTDSRPGSYSIVRQRIEFSFNKESISPNWLDKTNNFNLPTKVYPEACLYNFTPTSPDPRVMYIDEFRKCLNDVQKEKGSSLYCYGDIKGYRPLRDNIAKQMSNHRVNCSADEIMITGGTHSGLELICKLFRNNKWAIVVESPVYREAYELFKENGAIIYEVNIDNNGIDISSLKNVLESRIISFIYTMPNYQNPTGYSSTYKNREDLLNLSEKYSVPIIEDGFSQDLRGTIQPVKSMDCNNNIIYLGTYSKSLFPGIRVGWINCHKDLINRLSRVSYLSNISGNMLIQAGLERFCSLAFYEENLHKISRIYHKRMNLALSMLIKLMPKWVTFTKPSGGYLIWVKLDMSSCFEASLIKNLEENGVAVTPGSYYYPNGHNTACFRVSIAHMNLDEIENGIEILCKTVKKYGERDVSVKKRQLL